jgi:hypothetical protein
MSKICRYCGGIVFDYDEKKQIEQYQNEKKQNRISILTDVCQLLDGWHADVGWTEWDEHVRKRAAELLKEFST